MAYQQADEKPERVEQRKQMGAITVPDGQGGFKRIPAELTITDTFYPSGRKDVTVQVPRLSTAAKKKE